VIDDASLEMNVLTFREKSFSYEKTVELGGVEYAVFYRTEVESESKFRPQVVHLKLVVPKDAILGDLASDMLVLAPDGRTAGPRSGAEAVEVAGEESAFREQGIEFVRTIGPGGLVLYLPKDAADGLAALL
jgi:glutamine phosphoribosylpyrophosphate amidotransferase